MAVVSAMVVLLVAEAIAHSLRALSECGFGARFRSWTPDLCSQQAADFSPAVGRASVSPLALLHHYG